MQCLCKGHIIYCFQTVINIAALPVNMTFLYLSEVVNSISQNPGYDNHEQRKYPNLSLLNMTNSRIQQDIIYNFLLKVPNLRILLMTNCSINDLNKKFFTRLHKLNVLELQGNQIHLVSSECFLGTSGVPLLDLHGMSIRLIQPKSFEGMTSLKLLNLSYNELEDLSDEMLQYLPALSIVDFRGNTFTDIHSFAFHGVHINVYTSIQPMCCFVPATSTCLMDSRRY